MTKFGGGASFYGVSHAPPHPKVWGKPTTKIACLYLALDSL